MSPTGACLARKGRRTLEHHCGMRNVRAKLRSMGWDLYALSQGCKALIFNCCWSAFSNHAMFYERRQEAEFRAARRRPALILKVLCVCLCCTPVIAGCTALRRRPSLPSQYSHAHPPGFPSSIRWVGEMTERQFRSWEAAHVAGIARSAHGDPINILVLSGGGGAGAFGAGVLAGWSELGTRPRFQIVTGVSVGALIAPFAFLGPDWDKRLSLAFTNKNAPSLLERRQFGRIATLFGWSAYKGTPLKALVDRYVTPDLLRAIAAQSSSGRLLLVATTDLDSGQVVIWDMGAIAARGGRAALKLFRQVLVASASIPGVFPPVLIPVQASHKTFDEMNVDGSASSAFLFAPGIVSILPGKIKALHGANVYLVINGHLRVRNTTTSNRTAAILMRSIDTELASDSRARVKLIYSFAHRQGVTLKVTQVPMSYRLGGFTAALQPGRMKALFAYGERCAKAGLVWGNALTVLNRVARFHASAHGKAAQCPVPATSTE